MRALIFCVFISIAYQLMSAQVHLLYLVKAEYKRPVLARWVKVSADDILEYFYFSLEIGFDNLWKSSSMR